VDDASLAGDLRAVIGKPIKDAKPVLARPQLPIGTRVDKRAAASAPTSSFAVIPHRSCSACA
jgi:hypothetical protein